MHGGQSRAALSERDRQTELDGQPAESVLVSVELQWSERLRLAECMTESMAESTFEYMKEFMAKSMIIQRFRRWRNLRAVTD